MNLNKLHNDIHEGALQLIAEHRTQLFAKARTLCDSEDEANELVIRTIDQAIRKVGTYAGEGNILSWMMAILVHLHTDDHRNLVVRGTRAVSVDELERYAGEDWSTDEQLLKNSDSEAIRNAIRGLDPKLHKVLMMRYYEDLSLKEISNVLRLPMGTVAWRLHAARRLLAGKLSVILGRTKKPIAVIATVLSFSFLSFAAVLTGWLADGDDGGEWDLPSAGEEERVTDRLALKQVLSELPRDDRRLIVLRYVGEWTQQKTADELGMTQVQVSRRERAILAQLRRRLTG